jgi:hypothetical protein
MVQLPKHKLLSVVSTTEEDHWGVELLRIQDYNNMTIEVNNKMYSAIM